MPTFMTKPIFDDLCNVRKGLLSKFPDEVSSVFVPWAGKELLAAGGIYYIGQATHEQSCPTVQPSYEDSLNDLTSWCQKQHNYYGMAFWRYLNNLCKTLLNQPAWECSAKWGWSNLMKIELIDGRKPSDWPEDFKEPQRSQCVNSLKAELFALKNSLVVIASNDDFGILFQALDVTDDAWQTEYRKDDIYYWWDKDRNVLYVHGNHPSYAVRQRPTQLDRTIDLARKHLRWAN